MHSIGCLAWKSFEVILQQPLNCGKNIRNARKKALNLLTVPGDRDVKGVFGVTPGFAISAIIPVHNGRSYIGEALDSVFSQTRPVDETIVIDDGSDDGSGEWVRKRYPRVRCVSIPHGGIAGARNRGVLEARGGLVAFLDADDLWLPRKTALQEAAFLEDGGLEAVFGHAVNFLDPESSGTWRPSRGVGESPFPAWAAGAMMVRKDLFLRIGTFDETLTLGEFVDWWSRAVDDAASFRMLDATVLYRRVHDGNTGTRLKSGRSDFVRIARSALARRKRSGVRS